MAVDISEVKWWLTLSGVSHVAVSIELGYTYTARNRNDLRLLFMEIMEW
jgi:hypothetical protein